MTENETAIIYQKRLLGAMYCLQTSEALVADETVHLEE